MTTPVSIHGDWAVPSPFRQPIIVCVWSAGAACWAATIAVVAQIATTPPKIASFISFSFSRAYVVSSSSRTTIASKH